MLPRTTCTVLGQGFAADAQPAIWLGGFQAGPSDVQPDQAAIHDTDLGEFRVEDSAGQSLPLCVGIAIGDQGSYVPFRETVGSRLFGKLAIGRGVRSQYRIA